MSISRTKVNALVDDDGSNQIGTPWKKQNVVDIYDDIDLLLANRIDRAFAAGNYTGNGSMTVTLDAGDVNADYYQVTNKMMTYWFEFQTFSIGGTPSTAVKILMPGSFNIAKRAWKFIRINDNGTLKVGLAIADPSVPTQLFCYVDTTAAANWAASTNNSGIVGYMQIPIA